MSAGNHRNPLTKDLALGVPILLGSDEFREYIFSLHKRILDVCRI